MEDLYVKLEKIGGGNFSSVFRGKDKKNNQEVAIKVIETFKLSVAEKEVLKR
jgi:serine/threonine protein kinase